MSHISVRPTSPTDQSILDALENLPISGTNQAIAKTSSTTFANVTFGAGGSTTLATISASSLTAPNSLYTMTPTIPVEFRSSDGNTVLKLDEANEQVLFGNGTAALPSVSFNSDPDVGMYSYGANTIGFATGGVSRFFMTGSQFGAGVGGQTIDMPSSGGFIITASGTNQNITLTPSGSGSTYFQSTDGTSQPYLRIWRSGSTGNLGGGFSIGSGGSLTAPSRNWGFITNSTGTELDMMYLATGSWLTGGASTPVIRLASNANVLFGTSTDSSNGRIQLATHTTSAGGIGFGTDNQIYRRSTGVFGFDSTSATMQLVLSQNGNNNGYLQATSAGVVTLATNAAASLILQTNNITALTLDSSQNATFAGTITGTTIFAGAGNSIVFTGKSKINSPTDGILNLLNQAGTDFSRVNLGTATASFPALGRSTTFLTQTLADGTAGGGIKMTGLMAQYNNVNTTGWGIPAIYGTGRSTAQTAAVASVATYTVGAADGSFIISSNVNVTTSTLHTIAVQVDYTDETNTGQTVTLSFSQLAGTFVNSITNATGAGPYEGIPLHIRCKASTAITVKTTGTFTTVTYNVEGSITQIS